MRNTVKYIPAVLAFAAAAVLLQGCGAAVRKCENPQVDIPQTIVPGEEADSLCLADLEWSEIFSDPLLKSIKFSLLSFKVCLYFLKLCSLAVPHLKERLLADPCLLKLLCQSLKLPLGVYELHLLLVFYSFIERIIILDCKRLLLTLKTVEEIREVLILLLCTSKLCFLCLQIRRD